MNRLKFITIILGAVYMPLALFIGYCLGAGNYLLGIASLILYAAITLIDGYIFWKLIDGGKNQWKQS